MYFCRLNLGAVIVMGASQTQDTWLALLTSPNVIYPGLQTLESLLFFFLPYKTVRTTALPTVLCGLGVPPNHSSTQKEAAQTLQKPISTLFER